MRAQRRILSDAEVEQYIAACRPCLASGCPCQRLQLAQSLQRARAALRAVEWDLVRRCTYCRRWKAEGHHGDCVVHAALGDPR